jgi:hypothetical protein
VGLSLQSRAAGFGSGRRRGALYGGSESRLRIGSLKIAEPAWAAAAVRARGSKPIAPLRAKKSSGGTRSSPLFYSTPLCGKRLCRFPCAIFSRFDANLLDSNRIGYKISLL